MFRRPAKFNVENSTYMRRRMGKYMKWGCTKLSLAGVGFVTVVVIIVVTVFASVLVMRDSSHGDHGGNVLQIEGEGQSNGAAEAPEAPLSPVALLSPLMVNLSIVEAATSKGAVCLDGTPPGYHFHRGFGPGSNSWLIHLEGGGWCETLASCGDRKNTALGSSMHMERQIQFSGILSNQPSENPDFYNWNRVKVRYCDGASFSGDVEDENQEYKVFFRGQRIWKSVMEDLLAKGMDKADKGFLSGCSAGGLASFLHCDNFQELLPQNVKVKCIGDGGFFLDVKDISGASFIKSFYSKVITLQEVSIQLPKSCTSQMDSTMCFFPQYFLGYVDTPFFILNSPYDSWQIQNILAPDVADPQGHWQNCKYNISSCNETQLETLQDFRTDMLRALKAFVGSKLLGIFINSCFIHCQSEMQQTWFSQSSPRLHNKTIAEAVGDWYFDRNPIQDIDCPYPCDSTCFVQS